MKLTQNQQQIAKSIRSLISKLCKIKKNDSNVEKTES